MDDDARAVVGAAGRLMKAPLLYVGGTLATSRLTLEPLTPAHAGPMFTGFADGQLYLWVNADPPKDVADLESRFARIADPYAPGITVWWKVFNRTYSQKEGWWELFERQGRTAR